MFNIDYEHTLCDHGRLLILIKNWGSTERTEAFSGLFSSISVHHEFVFPKSRLAFRAVPNIDAKSEISGHSAPELDQPVWTRCVQQYSTVNNSWHTFQGHRGLRGLVGVSWCSSSDDVATAIQMYLHQKSLVSETVISGRLFILIHTDSDSTLTIQEAKQVIDQEVQKLPATSVFNSGELLAHPADQLFTHVAQTQPLISNNKLSPAPLLNNRLANEVTDMVNEIYSALQREVNCRRSNGTTTPSGRSLIRTHSSSSMNVITNSVDAKESGVASDLDTVNGSVISGGGASAEGFGQAGHPELSSPDESLQTMAASGSSSPVSGSGRQNKFSAAPFVNFSPLDSRTVASALPTDGRPFKQRRSSGRWKKHLGDLYLQLGDFDLAQLYYESTLQLLRPLMDHLWVAATLEGQCAVAVLRRTFRNQFANLLSSTCRRPLHTNRQVNDRSVINSETADGLDLAPTIKVSQVVSLQLIDYCTLAGETLELYRKALLERPLLEETTFKVARLYVAEKHNGRACELLDQLLATGLSQNQDDVVSCSLVKHLSTIVELFIAMGYRRRAGFVAWLAFKDNLFPPNNQSLQPLIDGLQLKNTATTMASSANDAGPSFESVFSAESYSILSTAIPPSLYPGTLAIRPSAFLTKGKRMLLNSSAKHYHRDKNKALFASSTSRGGLSLHRWGIRQGDTMSASLLRPLGWSQLQVVFVGQLVDRLKNLFNLEDAPDLSWERALILVGYTFSLLDGWPNCLDGKSCLTCMDDLCRLAVVRCSDQPRPSTFASSNYSYTSDYVSGNVDRRGVPPFKQAATMPNSGLSVGDRKIGEPLRQLVDLIQVPVHQLPSVRVITILPVPSHLLPRHLSKEAAAAAVPIPESYNQRLLAVNEADEIVEGRSKLFVYEPDLSESTGPSPVDWVCEESGDVELLVDNHLPVALRISELNIELTLVASATKVPSPPSSEAGSGINLTNGAGTSPLVNCVKLPAVRIVLHLPAPPGPPTDGRPAVGRTSSVTSGPIRMRRISRQMSYQPSQSSGTDYRLILNETCLLELADEKIRHPFNRPEPDWRRRSAALSCSLPARTSGIRVIVSVVPTTDMLSHPLQTDAITMYRITGMTYRLVDCGGIHVSLRSALNVSCASDPLSQKELPGHDHRPSSYASSSIPSEQSSAYPTLGTTTYQPVAGFTCSEPGDSVAPQPASLSHRSGIFSSPAVIQLKASLPKLHIFPGYIRSATSLVEAKSMLPRESIPSLTELPLAERFSSSSLPSFNTDTEASPTVGNIPDGSTCVDYLNYGPPVGSLWSKEVILVYTLTLYPGETRWMPLQLLVHDPIIQPESSSDPSSREQTARRYLNVLHSTLESDAETGDFLKRIQLRTDEVVQPVGLDEIQNHRMPIGITNPQIQVSSSAPSKLSDEDENLPQPLYASVCGHIWLRFTSLGFWNKVSLLSAMLDRHAFCKPNVVTNLSELQRSRKLSFELELEYAVNVAAGCHSSSINRHPCRRVRLGLQIRMLSSKHSPLMLYYPRLAFEDDPVSDDEPSAPEENDEFSTVKPSGHRRDMAESSPQQPQAACYDVRSLTFFYCTVQARLPIGLVPTSIATRDRQYRVDVEVTSACRDLSDTLPPCWRDRPAKSAHIVTPWTFMCELPGHARPSELTCDNMQPTSGGAAAQDVSFSEGGDTESQLFDRLGPFHVIRLPIDYMANRLLSVRPLRLVTATNSGHRDTLRTDEIGLPIPVNPNLLASLVESCIEINWRSMVHSRYVQTSVAVIDQNNRKQSAQRGGPHLPIPTRFQRFGRLILSSHVDSSGGNDQQNSKPLAPHETAIARHQKPSALWYGSAFDTPAAVAGLLWCHNLRLYVTLSDFASPLPGEQYNPNTSTHIYPPKSRLCLSCRSHVLGKPKRSIFSNPRRRHITAPPSLSTLFNCNGNSEGQNEHRESVSNLNSNSGNGVEKSLDSFLRRMSQVDAYCPKDLTGFSMATLNAAVRICTYPLHPIAIQVRGWVLQHPLKDLHFTLAVPANETDGDAECNGFLATFPIPVQIHRVWTGPAVYEQVKKPDTHGDNTIAGSLPSSKNAQQSEAGSNVTPKFSLRGPLADGTDFAFLGKAGGEIGLTLHSPTDMGNFGSVVFFRPGRFWICGLIGLLSDSVNLPSIESPTPTSFTIPSARDVTTVRFSPNGIYVHVLDPNG